MTPKDSQNSPDSITLSGLSAAQHLQASDGMLERLATQLVDGLRSEMKMGMDSVVREQHNLGKGVERIEDRLDGLVTKAEFSATVERLELKDASLESSVEGVQGHVDNGFAQLRSEDRERNAKNRWFWGIMFSGVGVANAVVFGVLNFFVK